LKRQTIRTIIFLATLSIMGIVVTQIFWVTREFDLKEKEFNDRVNIALQNVAKEIFYINKDSTRVPPVKQVSSNYFIVSTNDTLHPYLLETLLKSEFETRNIKVDFEYGIYDCFTDSIVYGKYVNMNDESKNDTRKITKPPYWGRDSHYFGVYFPTKKSHLLSQMGIWAFSSAILFIVVIFFAYTISVILKQKRLSEIKTDFINNLTHELKTPIATMSITGEMLMRPEISGSPERLSRYARIIVEESARLKNQVERVLQMSAFETQGIKLNKITLDLHELIEQLVESMGLIIAERKGNILCKLNAAEHIIEADKVHLTNIIYNLLDNAVKYSSAPPEITISTANVKNGIVMSVEDKGIGMSKEAQKYIFTKFYRVPTGNVHNVKGFGLGLNYVKLMTEAHGGKVKLHSEPGVGSRFDVYLPFK